MYHQSHLIDVSSTPVIHFFFFFSSRRRHTRFDCDWSSDVCSSDLETLLGDTAVAVNPTDKRHRAFVGKVARLPIIDLPVPIVADDAVEPGFGTGFVKVTPAHDATDFEIGRSEERRVGKECRSRWSPYH